MQSSSKHIVHGAAAVFITLGVAACGDGGSGAPTDAHPSSSVAFAAESTTLIEAEPNDSVDAAQALGPIAAGQRWIVRGSLAPGETYDAFEALANERLHVRVELAGPKTGQQVGLFDPLALALVARGTARVDSLVRGPFDVVVRATEDAASAREYTLVIHAEPVRAQSSGGWLGALAAGDQLTLRGEGNRLWTATASERQHIVVRAGKGVRVMAQLGDDEPLIVEAGEQGELFGDALARLEIETEAEAAFELELQCAPADAAATIARARTAPQADERRAWNAPDDAPVYGRIEGAVQAGELLVLPRAGVDLERDLAARSARVADRIPDGAWRVVLDLPSTLDESERARLSFAYARSLLVSPHVEYAELNRVRKP